MKGVGVAVGVSVCVAVCVGLFVGLGVLDGTVVGMLVSGLARYASRMAQNAITFSCNRGLNRRETPPFLSQGSRLLHAFERVWRKGRLNKGEQT